MANVDFKVSHHQVVSIPAADAAQLGLHLAFFGPDSDTLDWRGVAAKIAVAVEIAEGGAPALLELTDTQRAVLREGLVAMLDARAGNISLPLLDLRDACTNTDNE